MNLPGWRQPKDQDIAEAKRLLSEAGYPNGFRSNLVFQRGISHPTITAEPVASQLKVLGIDATVTPMEPGVYTEATTRRFDYDMDIASFGGSTILETAYSRLHSQGGTKYKYSPPDPELDRLLDAASRELDDTKRNQLYVEVGKRCIEIVCVAPTVTLGQFVAMQPWLHDYAGSRSVSPSQIHAFQTWMEVDKMPANRRSW
jgi:ABC-type transport system substrate-binding protein